MIRRPRLSRIVFTLSYPTLLIALFALIKSGASIKPPVIVLDCRYIYLYFLMRRKNM